MIEIQHHNIIEHTVTSQKKKKKRESQTAKSRRDPILKWVRIKQEKNLEFSTGSPAKQARIEKRKKKNRIWKNLSF